MPELPHNPVEDAVDGLVSPEERERAGREMPDPAPEPGEIPFGNASGSGGSGGGGSGSGGDGSDGGDGGDGGSDGGDGGDGGCSGGGDGDGGGTAAMGGEDGGTEHNLPSHFRGVPTLHRHGIGDRLGRLVDPSHPTQPHVDPRVTDPNPA
jgi:hypothetical protein